MKAARLSRRDGLGGTEGNEFLTSAAATVLVILLATEGITLLRMRQLVSVHMFAGLMLVGPVLLKLGSTGYRFARYYTGSVPYREKGPPLLPLRLLAPVLVAATVCMLGTGIWLMALGHKSDQVLLLHKVSFFVWVGVFGVHFLAHVPRMVRAMRADWGPLRHVPGKALRGALVVCSVGAGTGLALALLSTIDAWHGRHH